MADINVLGSNIQIPFCVQGNGTAYAVRCLTGSYLPLVLELKTITGSVRSSVSGTGRAYISLSPVSMDVGTGVVKGVNRAGGRLALRLNPVVKGEGCIRSFISSSTSKQAFELLNEGKGQVLTPVYSTKNLRILISHWSLFIPEIAQPVFSQCTIEQFNKQEHIDIEVMKEYLGSDEFRGDRRDWLVARVKFKCRTVMYLLNMGWPGVYNPMSFILDTTAYQHLIHYLFGMIKPDRGGESTYRYSIDGTVLDRVRRLQQEPLPDISRLPEAIRELVNIYGDYDPLIRERVYGVNQ